MGSATTVILNHVFHQSPGLTTKNKTEILISDKGNVCLGETRGNRRKNSKHNELAKESRPVRRLFKSRRLDFKASRQNRRNQGECNNYKRRINLQGNRFSSEGIKTLIYSMKSICSKGKNMNLFDPGRIKSIKEAYNEQPP